MTDKDLENSAQLAFKDVVRDLPMLYPEGETMEGFLRFKAGFLKGVQYMCYNEISATLEAIAPDRNSVKGMIDQIFKQP